MYIIFFELRVRNISIMYLNKSVVVRDKIYM